MYPLSPAILRRAWWLLGLSVPRELRGGRQALVLMAEACRSADVAGRYLLLQAYPIYDDNDGEIPIESLNQNLDRDLARLIRGYSQFGFVHSGGGYMYREPNTPLDLATQRMI
jgi:hypothetical protein